MRCRPGARGFIRFLPGAGMPERNKSRQECPAKKTFSGADLRHRQGKGYLSFKNLALQQNCTYAQHGRGGY